MRASGAAEEFGECGTLLGVFEDPVINDSSTVLQPGDALTLYTDGLPEANAPHRLVTVQELLERLGGSAPRYAQETIESLLELVDLSESARDDVAILSARVKP